MTEKVKMKNLYCLICSKYGKFEKPKMSLKKKYLLLLCFS